MLSMKKNLQCRSLSFYCVKISSTSDKQSLLETQSNFFLFKKRCEKEDDGLKGQKSSWKHRLVDVGKKNEQDFRLEIWVIQILREVMN